MSPPGRRFPWAVLLAFDGALAICYVAAFAGEVPGPARMLASALLVLVLPGAAWLGLFRRHPLDAPRLALAVVGLSSIVAVAALALTAAGPEVPSRALLFGGLVLAVNAGLLIAGPPGPLDPGTPWGWVGGVAGAGFLVTSLAGLYLVPPLEDHDMEVRGTAYGLAATLKPYFQTNREVTLPFAHPILFHVHVAESLLLTGEIDATRRSYRSALGTEAALRAGRPVDTMEVWRGDHREFVREPALVGTRAPSALLAGLVLGLLSDLVRRLTGRVGAGLAAAALYASFPETVVRAAYAGYFSVTVFAMLVAAMLFAPEPNVPDRRMSRAVSRLGWFAAAGALAALVDHKTVVLVLGVLGLAAARAIVHRLRERGHGLADFARAVDRRAIAIAAGFGAGTLLWWGYGMAVDRESFVRDHLRMHIAHRILLNDVRLAGDPERYAPSMVELWVEFAAHTGWGLVPLALVVLSVWIAGGRDEDPRAILAAWFLTGAVLYTLTDWRQTKHLMNGLAPMVAAAATCAWPGGTRGGFAPVRLLACGLLVGTLFFNLRADLRLLQDFRSLTIHGASDIDGW